MRAVVAEHPGGPEVLRIVDRPRPSPAADELLVRVRATSVNRVDLVQRAGAYRTAEPGSDVLGLDLAGEVQEIGSDVTGWRIGDRVCGIVTGGAYAEYAVIPAAEALPIPAGVSTVDAAAIPEVFATAWDNLVLRGHLGAGATALIHGGASGVGSAGIQLATHVGATAFVTVSGPQRGVACTALGAHAAIDYRSEDFALRVAELTAGAGVDVILDMVGQAYLERNLHSLAVEGRLVIIGSISGDVGALDVRYLRRRRLVVTGSTLRDRPREQRVALVADLRRRVWPGFDDGTLRPVIDTIFPLAEVAAAHAALEEGHHVGKIVVSVE